MVKRYINEIGSAWIRTITDPKIGNRLIISRITWVEVLSAFARLQREGNLAPNDIATAIRAFRYGMNTQYQLVELDQTLIETAGYMVQKHPLRAYDSVQLASALKLQPAFAKIPAASFVFVSADTRLLTVAQAESLFTDNPNSHP